MRSLIFNSCWILGLALLLASFSYHYHQARVDERPLSRQLSRRSFAGVAWLALALVGVGAAGTSQQIWEMVVWALLTLYAVWQAAVLWFSRKPVAKE